MTTVSPYIKIFLAVCPNIIFKALPLLNFIILLYVSRCRKRYMKGKIKAHICPYLQYVKPIKHAIKPILIYRYPDSLSPSLTTKVFFPAFLSFSQSLKLFTISNVSITIPDAIDATKHSSVTVCS